MSAIGRFLFCACVLFVCISSQPVYGDVDSSTVRTDDGNDGPHVYWVDQSHAIAFYLCDGSVVRQEFEDMDTVRFQGFCKDTANEYVIPSREIPVEPCRFDDVSRIFAVSDVHGEYEAMVELLINAEVIDSSGHWMWGAGHLVVLGDVFDRGDCVTECLWLIYRLEQEARQAGGRVHYLLGNHDEMILLGDLRYVNEKYLKGVVRKTKISYPDLFGPQMEFGRWLRTKHTMVKLNDLLFVHGGIDPGFSGRGLGLEYVNETVREALSQNSAVIAFNEELKQLFGGDGPFWYRGLVTEYKNRRAATVEVEDILDLYGVSAIIVGHTEVDQVTSFYGGMVTAIDVPLEELGSLQGYLWEKGIAYRVTGTGERQILH